MSTSLVPLSLSVTVPQPLCPTSRPLAVFVQGDYRSLAMMTSILISAHASTRRTNSACRTLYIRFDLVSVILLTAGTAIHTAVFAQDTTSQSCATCDSISDNDRPSGPKLTRTVCLPSCGASWRLERCAACCLTLQVLNNRGLCSRRLHRMSPSAKLQNRMNPVLCRAFD
jgi:hypothetical protein